MRARLFLPLTLLLAVGEAGSVAAQAGDPGDVDFVLVEKAARRLTLYSQGRAVRVYNAIQLGGAPVGAKHFEGDERTPEGRYTIDYGNPDSAYHLSLHISYPSPRDTAYARAHGRSPGGMIMIHGQPNGWAAGRAPGDWTDGCIALSNAQIEQLWETVGDGTPIEIRP
ncbi:L,D-transpeptidase family protein [Novosphingobium sp. ZN18A2]|uniref:L,D-transpeptidase family protein n=1 Tax=Novosphingobium sp. ZN18A2 TaxID=3079861 RepID=UPI0030D60E3E